MFALMFSNTKPGPLWPWFMSLGGVMDIDINDFEFIGFTSDGKRRYKRKVKETTFKVPHRDIFNFESTNYQVVPFKRKEPKLTCWIPEYIGQYQIDDLGNVTRSEGRTYRKANVSDREMVSSGKMGAPAVTLKHKTEFVSVLVLRAFCRYENRYEIPFHKDGNMFNHALENLEWRDFRQTDSKHHKEFAEMIGRHCDMDNYVEHKYAGKRFNDGVLMPDEVPEETAVVVKTNNIKRLPNRGYIGRIATGHGKSVAVGNKPKALPPPKAANQTPDETVVEIISKEDWDNRDIKDITPNDG
jgi:hypothetical protein